MRVTLSRGVGSIRALALVVIAAASGASAAPIEAMGTARAGGVYEISVVLKAELNLSGEAPGPGRKTELLQRATIRLAPEDEAAAGAAKQGDTLIFRADVEGVSLTWRENAGDGEMVETAIVRPKVTMDEEPQTPMGDSLRAIAKALGEADIRLFVVAGEGVARVGGLEGVEGALEANPEVTPRVVGVFAPMELARALSALFAACGAAGAEDPGAGWATEEVTDLGPAGALRIEMRWKPTETAGAYGAEGTMEVVALGGPNAEGLSAPVVTLDSQAAADEMVWDAAADALVSHHASRAFTGSVKFGALVVKTKMESERTLERVEE